VPVTGSSSSSTAGLGGASAGPSLGGSGGATGGATGGETGSGRAGATGSTPDGVTRIGSRDDFDTSQRYEPTVQHDSGEFARVSPPKDANWLADKEGFDRLNSATDEPLYFRGESDGELYDLAGASTAEGVYGRSGTGTSNTTTSGAGGASGTENSIRDL